MELNEEFEKTITDEKIERWRYPRFFTENIGRTAVLTPEDSKHISGVLRMKAGEYAVVCDGNCNDYLCRVINPDKNAAELEIIDSHKNEAEAGIYLRLFQCCPKSDKMEFIIQKATELGACEVIPVLSKRCVSRPDPKSAEKKRERYQKIAEEAAKQCGRGRIPEIMPMITFEQAVRAFDKNNTGLLFYECGGKSINEIMNGKTSGTVDIFIGPEGGFEAEEAVLAAECGIVPASLGKRILRCETAPVAAISVLMNVTGNM
ncbi:MAG: 16S rRNA (uracil(1498)-N(3))-methyltransferase [Ruminiclostridium sp.]|nr:16S rRNA (uracil(1498)-N(3))-methyltransferase [Ruminiclostridium sp.]